MSSKHYVGFDLTGFEDNGKLLPISRLTFQLDDENIITSGDDNGLEIVANCPYATQEMADALLDQLKGFQYNGYTANAVNIDPAAELGDGVTVQGVYSVISTISDKGNGYPNITAPGGAEMEEEFPSQGGPMTREINKKLAETRSTISKTAEEIRLEVEKEVEGLSSAISVNADKISWVVSSGTSASDFTLTDRAIKLVSDTIDLTGFVTFNSLATPGQTVIDGGNIKTNSISADKINVSNLTVNRLQSDDGEVRLNAFSAQIELHEGAYDRAFLYTADAGGGGVLVVYSGNVNNMRLGPNAKATQIASEGIEIGRNSSGAFTGSLNTGSVYASGNIQCGGIGLYNTDVSKCRWAKITLSGGDTHWILTRDD